MSALAAGASGTFNSEVDKLIRENERVEQEHTHQVQILVDKDDHIKSLQESATQAKPDGSGANGRSCLSPLEKREPDHQGFGDSKSCRKPAINKQWGNWGLGRLWWR